MIEVLEGFRFKKSERPTIMSGKVVTLAHDFRTEKGVFGDIDEPVGNFEVSASRDAVMVHRAECDSEENVDLLIEALRYAKTQLRRLRGPSNGY